MKRVRRLNMPDLVWLAQTVMGFHHDIESLVTLRYLSKA